MKKKIEDVIKPVIEKEGYVLEDVSFEMEGETESLVITINSEKGVSVEDCARVSRIIDPILEKEGLIKERSRLVVSSPGS